MGGDERDHRSRNCVWVRRRTCFGGGGTAVQPLQAAREQWGGPEPTGGGGASAPCPASVTAGRWRRGGRAWSRDTGWAVVRLLCSVDPAGFWHRRPQWQGHGGICLLGACHREAGGLAQGAGNPSAPGAGSGRPRGPGGQSVATHGRPWGVSLRGAPWTVPRGRGFLLGSRRGQAPPRAGLRGHGP